MKIKLKKSISMMLMFAVSIIAFSGLVHAGFSRQFNPEVKSFGVTVASQENMLVSASGARGTFEDYLSIENLVTEKEVSLVPLLGSVENTQDGTYEIFNLTNSSGGVPSSHQYLTFDLYFIGSSDMNLYLKGSRSGEVVVFDDSTAATHFTADERARLQANLRVAFLTYSTAYQYNEPIYSQNPVKTSIYATREISTSAYSTFNELGYSNTAKDTILAQTTKNEITKVKVVIWLEEDGLDDLSAICDLSLFLRFEAVLVEN